MKTQKIEFPKEVNVFIKTYFGRLSNRGLLKQVREMMGINLNMSTFRHQLIRLNCKPKALVNWNSLQTEFLINNFKTKGNIEIADTLNKMKLSPRKFNKKNIEKKLKLLGLKRTPEELLLIKANHKARGAYPGRTHSSPEGTIKIWSINGVPQKHIKINGRFVKYARHLYESLYGPIPKGFMIYFKDFNTMNVVIENLNISKRTGLGSEYHFKMKRKAAVNWIKINNDIPAKVEINTRGDLTKEQSLILVEVKPGLKIYVKPGTDIQGLKEKYNVPIREKVKAEVGEGRFK